MIHRTLNDANEYAAEMSSVIHGTYTVIALDDGTYETVNGSGRGKLVGRFFNGSRYCNTMSQPELTRRANRLIRHAYRGTWDLEGEPLSALIDEAWADAEDCGMPALASKLERAFNYLTGH